MEDMGKILHKNAAIVSQYRASAYKFQIAKIISS
jgi:hypothetical protein